MKKLFIILVVSIFVLTPIKVHAEDNILNFDTDELINELPESAKGSLSDLGINSPDINELNNLSFDKILKSLTEAAAEKAETPLKSLAIIIGIMLLCSLLYTFKSFPKTSAMQTVLSLCSTLCITLSVAAPVLSVIDNSVNIIKSAADFMLAYIPAIVFIIAATGRVASGTSYYSLTAFMGECVSRISGDIIAPFLRMMLALGITSAICVNVNLSGVVKLVSKVTKWILGFVTALFSSVLTIKQVISSGLDSVSDRAVKFSLTSFVPVCGAALSEAYKSVESSVGLLKSGVGVLALIAVAVMFLPVILECVLWMFSLWAAKSVGEMLGLNEPCVLLEALGGVVSVIFAVLIAVAFAFIISTAVVFMTGGAL